MESLISSSWLNDNFGDKDLVILDSSLEDNKAKLKSNLIGVGIKGARYFDIKKTFSEKNSKFPSMLLNPRQFEINCRKLGINKSSKIVVYDNLGIYSSPRVWWMFKTMGHDKVFVLNGGLPDWKLKGYEIDTLQNNDYRLGNFESNFQPEMIRDIRFVKGIAPEPRTELKSGSIPNSINIPFQSVLNNGKFKPQKELCNVFDKFDFYKRELVFSCGSGITACIVLLASELILKNKKSLYDGSWTEWVQLN